MRKNHWYSLATALVVAALLAFAELQRAHYFSRSDVEPETAGRTAMLMQKAAWFTYDLRSKFESNPPAHPDVVVIAITDDSRKELHQWPWPRGVLALLFRALAPAQPKAVAFDIFFVDPFTSDPRGDRELVEAARQYPWVVH